MFWSADCKYMKIMYVHCGEETNIRDPRSHGHYWTSSWNKTWINLRPVRDLNPWPLRYRCSALPTEPTSKLGADDYVGVVSFFFCRKRSTILEALPKDSSVLRYTSKIVYFEKIWRREWVFGVGREQSYSL